MMRKILKLIVIALGFLLTEGIVIAGGGGGGCGPSDNCSSASSLTANTTYSFDNSGCDAIADCEDCFALGGAACNNICSCAPCANEDCNTTVMGKTCSIAGAFCGSPENTSWGEFCAPVTGNYDFTVSNVSCSGGGGSLQFGIYQGGVTCGNNNQGNMLSCSGGVTANTTVTHALTAGQCYLIVFDGNAGATCTWDFLITSPPLPIKLEAFEANDANGGVQLAWATDINTDQVGGEFRFHRRFDDLVHENGLSADEAYNKMEVAELQSIGSQALRTARENEFTFLDESASRPGLYFYELYFRTSNGENRYLGTSEVYVDYPRQTRMINAFNGPGRDHFTLEFQVDEACPGIVEVFTTDGVLVREVSLGRMEEGIYRKSIELTGLSKGIYLYKLKLGGASLPGKIIHM